MPSDMESTQLKENETERKLSIEENNQSTMRRYIVLNSMMFEILENAPFVEPCRA